MFSCWGHQMTIVGSPGCYIRSAWFSSVIDEMQKGAGRLTLLDRIEAHTFLTAFPQSLAVPRSPAEELLLSLLLQRFAGETGIALHSRVHESSRKKSCSFVPCVFLQPFWKVRSIKPVAAFNAWTDAFFRRFDEVHPISVATRAAQAVRRRYEHSWDVLTLSKEVRTTASRLVNGFRREYGMSPRDYLRLVRLVMALERVRHDKIEAVALDLGYRSRKNFARAFKRVAGVTVTDFRTLPTEQLERITDAAQMMLSAPQVTARTRMAWSSSATREVAADRRAHRAKR